jgi:hypothetical protein
MKSFAKLARSYLVEVYPACVQALTAQDIARGAVRPVMLSVFEGD